jgi:NAD(P)-dependent dehydrogenase (short-subunit alcohol dehydrogenase family)
MDLAQRAPPRPWRARERGLGRDGVPAREGVEVTIVARTEATLAQTASEIGAAAWVACDITTPEGLAAALAACPDPDILVTNAGGPPPGDFRDGRGRGPRRAQHGGAILLIKATTA